MKSTKRVPKERVQFLIIFYNQYGEEIRTEDTLAPDRWKALETAKRRGRNINKRTTCPQEIAVTFTTVEKATGLLLDSDWIEQK